jgi:hypothetical protein
MNSEKTPATAPVDAVVLRPCTNCGQLHRTIASQLGMPDRPTSAREIANEIMKSGLRYTICWYISGKVICDLDSRLGKVWNRAFQGLITNKRFKLDRVKRRLRQMGLPTRRSACPANNN